MRKNLLLLLPLIFCFVLQGCLKDKLTRTYAIMVPVYKEKTAVYADIKTNAAKGVEAPGKMYIYGSYIFLNDIDKGVHIIDNSNPSNPVRKGFINIPGNLDIAVKGNTLYADLYSDLVVVDITNPLQARYVKHMVDIFPERKYSNGFIADSTRIIVGWEKKDTTVHIDNDRYGIWDNFILASAASGGSGGGSPVGIAGSMARFSIVNNFMYAVNNRDLVSLDISAAQSPVRVDTRNVGWQIETIYPMSNKLFIGSNTGMFIYDISNPAAPALQGTFTHVRACDPVIADGNFAYVTLRSGNFCNTAIDQLHIVNISNLASPVLTKTYNMTNPHGLTKSGNSLFICDGRAGLKVYNVADPMNIVLEKQLTGMDTYDAIAYNNNLIVVAKDGLYQYDCTIPGDLIFRSKIPVTVK